MERKLIYYLTGKLYFQQNALQKISSAIGSVCKTGEGLALPWPRGLHWTKMPLHK